MGYASGGGIGSGEAHVGEVGGNLISVAVEKTRPADTNAYTALDVIAESTSAATVWTFANAARVAAGSGYVVGARLAGNVSTETWRGRIILFHTSPTALNDNAQYTALYANSDPASVKGFGIIDMSALATEGTGSDAARSQNFDIRIPFKLPSGTSVFAILETLDAFTPGSGKKYTIELVFDRN